MWQPIETEFPPAGKTFLAFDAQYGNGHIYIALSDGKDYISDTGFHSNRLYKVTHWMPLPEPPK